MFWSEARRRVPKPVIAVAMTVALAAAILAASASATDYTYCNGCTIPATSWRPSNATRQAYISYVHRLSGPSGTFIIAQATFDPTEPWDFIVCKQSSTTTEASCGPGRATVYGQAWNGGAGNYG